MLSRRRRARAGSTFAVLPMLALAAPAAAELPPQVYERAREEDASVIVVDVGRITRPSGAFTEGWCTLLGRVRAVERGAAQRVGDRVAVALPCLGSRHRPMPGPFPGYDAARLGEVRRARLFLGDSRALVLRGFDPLPRSRRD